MRIQLKYFASIREAIGLSEEVLQTEAAHVAALRAQLLQRGGAYAQCLAEGQAVRMALNHTLCDDSTPLSDGAELAFFPPVTGG